MKNRFSISGVGSFDLLTSMMNSYSIKILACLLLTMVLLNASNRKGFNDKNYDTKLQIINNKTQITHNFLVKIVKNSEDRAKGLMFITNLPDRYGMLFEFETEQIVYMWMKNTKIPLDILFIDKDNKIVHIKHNALVDSTNIISSKEKVVKVLEINANQTRKLDINVGDYLLVLNQKSNQN